MNGWIAVVERVPVVSSGSVQVLAVIDDELLGDRHVDLVAYWPDDRWTVTYAAHADVPVDDFPCDVTHWQPLPELPA